MEEQFVPGASDPQGSQSNDRLVTRSLGWQVLHDSRLTRAAWPDDDPWQREQPTRLATDADTALVLAAGASVSFDFAHFVRSHAHLDTADRCLALLARETFNFNGVERVRNEPLWHERIASAVARNRPIEICYPLCCRIANHAKTGDATGPTAGELASFAFFAALGRYVRAIYEPGLVVHVLCDAALYAPAFGVPAPEAQRSTAPVNWPSGTCRPWEPFWSLWRSTAVSRVSASARRSSPRCSTRSSPRVRRSTA